MEDGFFGAQGKHGKHRNDIGKARLDTRQRHRRWDPGFHQEDGQGNGGQQPQGGEFSGFHGIHLLQLYRISNFLPVV